MLKHTSLPSIEEFAAFLDGNLSANDMQQFTKLAAHDDALHQLLHAIPLLMIRSMVLRMQICNCRQT